MGTPHPHADTLSACADGRAAGSSSAKSCHVHPEVQVLVQTGRSPEAVRQIRRAVVVFCINLVALASAVYVGQASHDWEPVLRVTGAVAEVDSVRQVLAPPGGPASAAAVQARARGLQVARLARAHAVLSQDEEAGLARMRVLYAHSADADIQQAALDAMVLGAKKRWPEGFRGDFLTSLLPAVLTAAREHQVPPSVTLAQAVLESGWGRSGLARLAHNLFGVKAGASSKRIRLASREHIGGRLRPCHRTFRTYESVDEAIWHHARILGEDRRYAHAREVWSDWPEFLARISPRYASSPRYPKLVSEIVEIYALDRWDGMIADAAARDASEDLSSLAVAEAADMGRDTGRDTGSPAP